MTRVLFVCPDAVGAQMAGLGIRTTELARVLSRFAEVVVATGVAQSAATAIADGVQVVAYEPHAPTALRPWIDWADTVVTPPQWPVVSRWLRRSGKRVVVDLYDPETLETLELFARRRPALRRLMVSLSLDRLDDALRCGHHFMCASNAQRDLWIGVLLGSRRVGPTVYDADRALRETIDIVPFGLPSVPPTFAGAGPREAFGDRIAPGDQIILWNGGIWPWLDAPNAVRAVARLSKTRPDVRLVFMGRGQQYAARAAFEAVRATASELGVLDTTVLFYDGWVPYAERSAWLGQASCVLATAGDHLETRYAFRTRLLDCFWAGVPIVCTSGDDLAARVGADDLGAVVAPGDVDGLASALGSVLERGRDDYSEALAAVARGYEWAAVAAPLRRWVNSAGPPRRLGRPGSRRPGHIMRSAGYEVVHRAFIALGRRWPSL